MPYACIHELMLMCSYSIGVYDHDNSCDINNDRGDVYSIICVQKWMNN